MEMDNDREEWMCEERGVLYCIERKEVYGEDKE